MSPKWGGVVLGGPSEADCRDPHALWRPNVRVVMGTFIAQLRELLGITDAVSMRGFCSVCLARLPRPARPLAVDIFILSTLGKLRIRTLNINNILRHLY